MTSLKSYILLEYVKQSPKLQEIECGEWWWFDRITGKWFKTHDKRYFSTNTEDEIYPAPTIADVIDSAESIFCKKNDIEAGKRALFFVTVGHIISLCYDNESIDEISEYILNNIK